MTVTKDYLAHSPRSELAVGPQTYRDHITNVVNRTLLNADNTLYVFTQGAYLRKESETVVVRINKESKLRLPLLNIGSISCFGRVGISPQLMGFCGEKGIAITFLTEQGRFLAAVNGFTSGNVLLRREQYRRADSLEASGAIARACIIGKLANYRTVLPRAL